MKRRSFVEVASVGSAASAFGATAWFISRDVAPPSWDDAWYLETSFRLWSALKSSPPAFWHAYTGAFQIKAPLIALIPLPLYAAFGPSERLAVWSNLPLAALSAWAWSRAASTWWGNHPRGAQIAALGGALAALLPISYGLSRIFFAETCVSCLLSLFAWRCAIARETDRIESVRLGVLFGLGCLSKVTFPLLSAGLIWSARKRLRPHAFNAATIAVVVASTWYAFNAPAVLGFAWSSGFGRIARDYSGRGGVLSRLDWVVTLVRCDLSWLMATFGAAASLAGAKRPRDWDPGTVTALWGLSPLIVYAVGTNSDVRLPAPLMPILSLLIARAAIGVERHHLRSAAVITLLASVTGLCIDQTFFAGPSRALCYNGKPASDPGWNRADVVSSVAKIVGPNAVAAVALEHRFLNANNLSSLAAEHDLKLTFVSLGYAQQSVESALIRLKEKNAKALVIVDGVPESELPPFLNRVNRGVAAAIASGRLPAHEVSRVQISPGIEARILLLGR